MSEQEYSKNAMSNFTFEVASGGAIRHLTDLGYTVSQIVKQLTFPTPYERVQKAVWEYLLDTGAVLLDEPGNQSKRETVSFVREYDKYGKPSFRKVVAKKLPEELPGSQDKIVWKEIYCGGGKNLAEFLKGKCLAEGQDFSYISCNFGLQLCNPDKAGAFMDSLKVLEEGQRDYILGLPWERKLCYHRLDKRMREIAVKLSESGGYHGVCYFSKSREKLQL